MNEELHESLAEVQAEARGWYRESLTLHRPLRHEEMVVQGAFERLGRFVDIVQGLEPDGRGEVVEALEVESRFFVLAAGHVLAELAVQRN